jgi:hypothetical protein
MGHNADDKQPFDDEKPIPNFARANMGSKRRTRSSDPSRTTCLRDPLNTRRGRKVPVIVEPCPVLAVIGLKLAT